MGQGIIGIDLGGTNLRIGVVEEDYQVHHFRKISSVPIGLSEDPMEELITIIQEYMTEQRISHIKAISIGVPSSVANDKETVICTTNIRNKDGEPVFQNRNVAKEISHHFRIPVYVNNDTKNILLYDMMKHKLGRRLWWWESISVPVWVQLSG